MGWEAVRLPAACAVSTLLRVSVLVGRSIVTIVVPAGMPVATVSRPEEAAVRGALRFTRLPGPILWIVVPAAMPRPVTVWPGARLFVLPTVTKETTAPAAEELLMGLTMGIVPIVWPGDRLVTLPRVSVAVPAAPAPIGRMKKSPDPTDAVGSMPLTGEPALRPATLARLIVLAPAAPHGRVMLALTVGVVCR